MRWLDSLVTTFAAALTFLGCFAPPAFAKEPSLTVIEIYDGPSGAA
jgi:hypothetical protein